jgi:hypothetical protein
MLIHLQVARIAVSDEQNMTSLFRKSVIGLLVRIQILTAMKIKDERAGKPARSPSVLGVL